MLYFGDPWPTPRDCKILYRLDIDANQYRNYEAFWHASAHRWTADGWVAAPNAQLDITEWENELWQIPQEKLGQAMVGVLERHGVAPSQIEDALRCEGVPFPDPEVAVEAPSHDSSVDDDDDFEAAGTLPTGLDIVFIADDGRGGALFAERRIAKIAADMCRAVTDSNTWGQFRQIWPGDDFDESNGYPPDGTPFDRSDLPALGEGFPEEPWPPDEAVSWFPEDLIDKYGCRVRFTSEGSDLYVPQAAARDIAEELRARGNLVEESADDLPTWTSYWF